MTSIIPPLQVPIGPAGSDQPLFDRNSGRGSEPNFAAILAQARNGSTGDFDPASVRIPLHQLKSAIAHVFNAFGFFPAEGRSEPPAPDDPSQSGPSSLPQGTRVETTGDAPVGSVQPVPIGTVVPTTHAVRTAAGPDRPAPTLPAIVSGRKHPESFAVAALAGGVAELHRAEQSLDRHGLAVSRLHTATRPDKCDEIHFRIGECAVDLLARLHNLSDEEEDRLIVELQAVLEEHGLTLASATINGTPFATGLLGRIN